MCLICIELEKGRLTAKEAFRNMEEIIDDITGEHFYEVLGKIHDKNTEEQNDRVATGSSDEEK